MKFTPKLKKELREMHALSTKEHLEYSALICPEGLKNITKGDPKEESDKIMRGTDVESIRL